MSIAPGNRKDRKSRDRKEVVNHGRVERRAIDRVLTGVDRSRTGKSTGVQGKRSKWIHSTINKKILLIEDRRIARKIDAKELSNKAGAGTSQQEECRLTARESTSQGKAESVWESVDRDATNRHMEDLEQYQGKPLRLHSTTGY